MSIAITFQGPDYSDRGRPVTASEITIHGFVGFDLDYGTVTVYTNPPEMNYTLAKPAAMCNEEGIPLGEVGWRIEPDSEILGLVPPEAVGRVFGRVIVGGGELPVDKEAGVR